LRVREIATTSFKRAAAECYHRIEAMPAVLLLAAVLALQLLHGGCKAPPCLGLQHDSNLKLVREALEAECFDVTEGYLAFNKTCFPVSLRHPLSDVTCFGQNPSSPYGTVHLKTPILLNRDRPIWQLQQREAVLFLGCSPPSARYFGLQS
jgi:hypothetical protein